LIPVRRTTQKTPNLQAVVVEIKSIARFERVHSAQLLTYLRQSTCCVGLLINFNVKWLVDDGIKRVVNGFPDS